MSYSAFPASHSSACGPSAPCARPIKRPRPERALRALVKRPRPERALRALIKRPRPERALRALINRSGSGP